MENDLIRRSDVEAAIIADSYGRYCPPEPVDPYSWALSFVKDVPAVDAVEYELADDGTLEITVPNGTKVGRVLVSEAGTHLGGVYYPDAVDYVPMDFHDRCMQTEIRKRMEVERSRPEAGHGEWLKMDMHRGMENYKCSVCRSECYVPEVMGGPMFLFCPYCGAHMDGRREDGDA